MDNGTRHASHELDLGVATLMLRYWSQKKLIAIVVAVSLTLGLGLYFIKGKKYTATCTYSPPSSTSRGVLGRIAASNPELVAMAARFGQVEAPAAKFVQALGLRTVRMAIVKRFGLQGRFESATPLRAADALGGMTSVRTSTGGFIEVAVTSNDPELAASLANAYGAELNDFLREVATSRASHMRVFLEERLKGVKEELVAAEEALAKFKSTNKSVDIRASARQGMEVYARLMARVLELETTLAAMRSYQTDNSPDVVLVKAEIDALRRKLCGMEDSNGNGAHSEQGGNGGPVAGVIPTMTDLPEVALEEMRLLREFTVREKLYEFLTAELESARLEEAGSMPVLTMIQAAVPPEKASSMGLVMMVGLFGVLGGVASLLLVNVKEQLQLARAMAKAPSPDAALSADLLSNAYASGSGGNGGNGGNGGGTSESGHTLRTKSGRHKRAREHADHK